MTRLAATGAVLIGPLIAADPAQAGPPGGWEPIVSCESGGRNIPNAVSSASGYYQVIDGTWRDYGGEAFASRAIDASREEQTVIAERIYADRGLQPWDSSKACWSGKVGKHAAHEEAPRHAQHSATAPRHAKPTSYMIQPGDTLADIAAAHHTTWQRLFSANRTTIADPNRIYAGVRIDI